VRDDSSCYGESSFASYGQPNHLHWHDGGTCHGYPTLEQCAQNAVANGWIGKVLEKTDTYRDGTTVKCYSLIASHFDHYAKQGRFVAEVKLVVVPLTQPEPHMNGA